MKTSELADAALDWAVMQCRGLVWALHGRVPFSTDLAQGGPIIEREYIQLTIDLGWIATRKEGPAVSEEHGPTPLIAAMRCYVASVLGDEVKIPATISETV
jgi:hypothetical protein